MWIDDLVKNCVENKLILKAWQPQMSMVVLGSSNQAELECHVDRCRQDGIEILRRKGGGGAVVLYPGCAIVSLGMWVKQYYQNRKYFELIHQAMVACLASQWPELSELREGGISDLVLGDKKVAGTSMFRSRNFLLYQGSFLVENGIDLINTYLQHPSREPEYRQGRSHRDFLCFIRDVCDVTTAQFALELEQNFINHLKKTMGDELIDPDPRQVEYIKSVKWD